MNDLEPTLDKIEDYRGEESKEKRLTIWIVVLSGLLIGALCGLVASNSEVSDVLVGSDRTGITRF